MKVTEEYRLQSELFDKMDGEEFLKVKFAKLLSDMTRLRENFGKTKGLFTISVSFDVNAES